MCRFDHERALNVNIFPAVGCMNKYLDVTAIIYST